MPLLLLCAARPEFLESRSSWAGGLRNASTILLEALPTDAGDALATGLLGGVRLPEAVLARLLEAAEGNPLFIEETLAMLVEDGHLRHGSDGCDRR